MRQRQMDFVPGRGKRVDLFAGAGGVSEAILLELGSEPDVAVNHDWWAIALHRANHPNTRHYQEDVYQVDPLEATDGQPVELIHASPDCTDHSQAKGGQPRRKAIRSLAWVLIKWVGICRPEVATLENVMQMLNWSPLVAKRDPKTGRVVKLDGTVAAPGERVPVQQQFLIADDRRRGHTWRRFVNILREKGYQVEWKKLKASDFGAGTSRERLFMMARRDGMPIVWPKPTHGKNGRQKRVVSAADSIDFSIHCPSIFDREKPLVDATLRRLATGCYRFVLNTNDPFIIPTQMGNSKFVDELMVPSLIQRSYGERKGQTPRTMDIREPLGTIVAGGVKHALVTTRLVAADQRARFLAFMEQANTGMVGHDMREPLSTIVGKGCTQRLVTATTVPAGIRQSGFEQQIQYNLSEEHQAGALRVAAFLMSYYSSGGQLSDVREPLNTVTTRDRFALVTVTIQGWPCVIVDLGMRMLTPRELYTAQGFSRSYIIDRTFDGREVPRTRQVKMVGNSVSPHPYRALLRANFPQEIRYRAAA